VESVQQVLMVFLLSLSLSLDRVPSLSRTSLVVAGKKVLPHGSRIAAASFEESFPPPPIS
jgi:hypothetical protein